MIPFILTLVLVMTGASAKTSSIPPAKPHWQKVKLTPFNVEGVPVRINKATAENSVGASWIEYSVTNVSGEEMLGIYLRVFVADSDGKLIRIRDTFSGEKIAAGSTQYDRAQIGHTVKEGMISFLAVRKVIGNSGVWQVDDSELEAAIQSRFSQQPELGLDVTFQPNAPITDSDRKQIFELILGDILQDEKKAKRLKDPSRVIVLRDSVRFDLPQIPQVNVSAFDQDETQRIADQTGRVIFLRYEPLTSEGSKVHAKISLREVVARGSGIHVPYKYTFLFTCARQNGRWIVEKFIGFAQS
jgi:hypothetical protein